MGKKKIIRATRAMIFLNWKYTNKGQLGRNNLNLLDREEGVYNIGVGTSLK